MYKIFLSIVSIIWLGDVFNLEVLSFLDTTIPINGWMWFCIWLMLPSSNTTIKVKRIKDKKKDKE